MKADILTLSASDAGTRFGSLLDKASKEIVRVKRRNERYLIMREEVFDAQQQRTSEAVEYPRLTLDELCALHDRTARAEWFDEGGPEGKEII